MLNNKNIFKFCTFKKVQIFFPLIHSFTLFLSICIFFSHRFPYFRVSFFATSFRILLISLLFHCCCWLGNRIMYNDAAMHREMESRKMNSYGYYSNEILQNMTNDHQSLSIATKFIIIIRLNFLFVIFLSYFYALCVCMCTHNNNNKIETVLNEIRNRFNRNWLVLVSTWRHTLTLIEIWNWKYYYIIVFYLCLISFLNRIRIKIMHIEKNG